MFTSAFVDLYTRDIEAGIRFYRDLLGFKETFRTPLEGTPEHVELKINGFGLGLELCLPNSRLGDAYGHSAA